MGAQLLDVLRDKCTWRILSRIKSLFYQNILLVLRKAAIGSFTGTLKTRIGRLRRSLHKCTLQIIITTHASKFQ